MDVEFRSICSPAFFGRILQWNSLRNISSLMKFIWWQNKESNLKICCFSTKMITNKQTHLNFFCFCFLSFCLILICLLLVFVFWRITGVWGSLLKGKKIEILISRGFSDWPRLSSRRPSLLLLLLLGAKSSYNTFLWSRELNYLPGKLVTKAHFLLLRRIRTFSSFQFFSIKENYFIWWKRV